MSGVKGRSGGHNRKALREKQLIGVRHKSRLSDNAPDRLPARVDMIDGLGDVGSMIFRRYEAMLHNNGTLSEADGMAFFGLCKRWEMWYGKMLELEKKGHYIPVKDKDGNVVDLRLAPWAKEEIEYFSQLMQCLRSFGLTPVDRASVARITRERQVNKFAGLT